MNEITGHLKTEPDSQGQRQPLVKYRVSIRRPGWLFGFTGMEIGPAITDADGKFTLHPTPNPEAGATRDLDVVAQDAVGRELPFIAGDGQPPRYTLTAERRARISDRPGTTEDFGIFVVRRADAAGLKVTLGTGQPQRYSEGNRVTTLMDGDAFAYAAAMMRHARQELLISQLFFGLPEQFHSDPAQEKPNVICDFAANGADNIDQPRAVLAGDRRPERLMIDTAARGVDTRLLLHAFETPWSGLLKFLVGVLLYPFVQGRDVLPEVIPFFDTFLTNIDEARDYFGDANATNIKLKSFTQPMLTAGVLHAKLVVMDRSRVLSIGSPFGQSYVDRHDHRIDTWTRGGAEGFPKHDAGFALTGPASADLFDTLKLLWNSASPGDAIPAQMRDPNGQPPIQNPPAGPAVFDQPEDGECAVQIVRTLSPDRFDGMPDGEKGILEAYLRGIANAQEFIYIENQYFTNDAIGDALVQALIDKPALRVIMLLNIRPDIPFYPFKQRRLITRMRRKLSSHAAADYLRLGIFTRWTHETTGPAPHPRPRILPIYLHAKLAIVDNTWATVGSANLDGLSIDSSLQSDFLHNLFNVREGRALELNSVLFENASSPLTVVDKLRRKLWAEHLGYTDPATGQPVMNAAPLQLSNQPSQAEGGWLRLWYDRSNETLTHLKTTAGQPSTNKSHVLPWPLDNTTHKTPRDHITALGIHSYAVAPLKSTRAFNFKSGEWNADSKAAMDF